MSGSKRNSMRAVGAAALAAALLAGCGGSRSASAPTPAPARTPAPTRTQTPTPAPTTAARPPAAHVPGCQDAAGYAATVGHYLCVLGIRYRQAIGPCTNVIPPEPCRRAVGRYRAALLAARADLRGLEPPSVAAGADRTMRQALGLALGATQRGLAALDTTPPDVGGWLGALGQLRRAGVRLQLANAQLHDALGF